jgi:hypothetical protein
LSPVPIGGLRPIDGFRATETDTRYALTGFPSNSDEHRPRSSRTQTGRRTLEALAVESILPIKTGNLKVECQLRETRKSVSAVSR